MLNPQNPYRSFILKASAGSGKTYQLSRRFLFLVAAGATPESILTITFTKKAAAEMRERILQEASHLLRHPQSQQEFDHQMAEFYNNSNKQSVNPLTSRTAAAKILSKTQSLQITTIDSIFLEWLSKFPSESQGSRPVPIPQSFQVPSPLLEEQLNRLAWEKTCHKIFGSLSSPLTLSPHEIYARLEELQKNETFYWLCQNQLGNAYCPHTFPPETSVGDTTSELIAQLEPEFKVLAGETKKAEQLTQAIMSRDWQALIELRLLTKGGSVSGATIRGKKREKYSTEIARIDNGCRNFLNRRKLQALNDQGALLTSFFAIYSEERDRLKADLGIVDFSDMSKGCLNLFANPDAFGARFLIHQKTHHLLLDEFQDTSRLQWAIFKSIAEELLAGQGLEIAGGLTPSAFIVGDEKQSIYGFREADAAILDEACDELAPLEVSVLHLDQSFRTSQTVLNLVNNIFPILMPSFPEHRTAQMGQKSFIPDFGSIAITDLFDSDNAQEEEAQFVAQYIHNELHKGELLVWDRQQQAPRPLKPSDCAILYRSSTNTHIIEKNLRAYGINSIRAESKGYFTRQEVLDLIHVLKFLYQANDLLSFMVMLKSPLTPFKESEFLKTLIDRRQDRIPQDKINRFLRDQEAQHSLFISDIELLQQLATKIDPASLILTIFKTLQPVKKYKHAFGAYEGKVAEQNLHRFLELAFELKKQGFNSLGAFLKKIEELTIEDSVGSSQNSSDAVHLMTIHKSKGLEFPFVIIVGLGEAWEKTDRYWQKSQNPTGFYYMGTKEQHPLDHKEFSSLKALAHDQDKKENLRLLYVALTRAKHHLLLTGHRTYSSKKQPGYWETIHQKIVEMGAAERSQPATHWTLQRRYPYTHKLLDATKFKRTKSMFAKISSPQKIATEGLELQTLAPARLLSKSFNETDNSVHDFTPYAREVGLYIHQILEYGMKGHSLADEAWQSFYPGGPKQQFEQVGKLAEQLTDRTMKSLLWQFLKKSERVEVEKSIVHLSDSQLMRGTIDLLLWREERKILVVDYKTVPISHKSQIPRIVIEKQYDQQIFAYVNAVKALYPQSQVNGAVYFTFLNEIILTYREYEDPKLMNLTHREFQEVQINPS